MFVRSGLYGPYVQRGMEGKAGFKRQPLPRVGRGVGGLQPDVQAGWDGFGVFFFEG